MRTSIFTKTFMIIEIFLLSITLFGCQDQVDKIMTTESNKMTEISASRSTSEVLPFLQGADLSYVNELQDCGVNYTKEGKSVDPYNLIKSFGANLVRVRLWHNPTWTNYSTLSDVKRSIRRAKDEGMNVLLDFHYSDTWTDPQQNLVPEAWRPVVRYSSLLADSVYNYTYNTLQHLLNNNLLPEMVQIGNETNNNILNEDNANIVPVNFVRNTKLFNAGLKAVEDFNNNNEKNIKTILHVAMTPNDAMNWIANHKKYGLSSFDMLGVSYYPQWQDYTPQDLGKFASNLYSTYGIRLFVAETGHIWTRAWNDENHNLMSKMCMEYPEVPCPQLQKDYLIP